MKVIDESDFVRHAIKLPKTKARISGWAIIFGLLIAVTPGPALAVIVLQGPPAVISGDTLEAPGKRRADFGAGDSRYEKHDEHTARHRRFWSRPLGLRLWITDVESGVSLFEQTACDVARLSAVFLYLFASLSGHAGKTRVGFGVGQG